MNEGRFWAWRPWSQALSGDVSLHPPCADTACKYTAWQMAWLCSSPPTNLWQAGLMPERLADRPCLIHCHKRHIVYRTERHCNTNTNTPRVGDTLGNPLVCGSSIGLKENIARRSLLLLLAEKCLTLRVLPCTYILMIMHHAQFFALAFSPCSSYTSLASDPWLSTKYSFARLWLETYIFTIANLFSCFSQRTSSQGIFILGELKQQFFFLFISVFGKNTGYHAYPSSVITQ